jgi:hypothetical protein
MADDYSGLNGNDYMQVGARYGYGRFRPPRPYTFPGTRQGFEDLGNGIHSAVQRYQSNRQALDGLQAVIDYAKTMQTPGKNGGKPTNLFTDDQIATVQRYHDQGRISAAENAMRSMGMDPASLAKTGQATQKQQVIPLLNSDGIRIGEQNPATGARKFYPNFVTGQGGGGGTAAQNANTKQLAAAQKPLLSEMKDISNEFQKNTKNDQGQFMTPEAFLNTGVKVTPGDKDNPTTFTIDGKQINPQINGVNVDPAVMLDLQNKAQRYQDLKQAVTTPDPAKTLQAINWVRQNQDNAANDDRVQKWQNWINSQTGKQPIVDTSGQNNQAQPQSQDTGASDNSDNTGE